jgi:hypothetical protein
MQRIDLGESKARKAISNPGAQISFGVIGGILTIDE